MTEKRRVAIVFLLGLALGAGMTIYSSVFAGNEKSAAASSLPLEDLRAFTEVFGRVKSDYVESVEDKELLEHAIKGMLSGLDPHSSYLNAEEFKEMRIGTDGKFGGLGIEVSMENGFVKVISPIDDTPAERAGIKAGDVIVRLDDTPVKGMTLNEAVKIMRGEPGTDILLTVVREGAEGPLKITITRDIIRIKSVRGRTLDPGYGYIRISQFQSATGTSMRKQLSELKKENGGELKGLVLDLRNNPGGVLNASVSVADAFVSKGKIVYTEGRVKDSLLTFNASPNDLLKGAPIVVLVNGGSASASEIVAGALQDHHRAIIMGTKTFGKGSVQTIMPMNNGAALKITTARYFTPSGRSIQAEGIEPDIEVEQLELSKKSDASVERLREANLRDHLENGNGEKADKAAKDDKSSKKEGEDDEKSRTKDDYQLNEALNLLKGVNIVRQIK
ncbi:MAG: S41 family peptidase [Gammaproteobacteria bacterium]|nr:S41 family peptidase [Gammaproteobacteria bacterium]MDX2487601.1 S41 family peptidase [Gammaproteobacteria bacterium]